MTIEDAFYVRSSIQFTAQDAGASRLIYISFQGSACLCVMWTNANWRQSDSINRRMHFLSFLGIFKILHDLIRASLCLGVIEVLQLQVKVINNSLLNFAVPRNALFPGLNIFPRCLVHRVCAIDSRWRRTSKTKKKVKPTRWHVTNINNSSLKNWKCVFYFTFGSVAGPCSDWRISRHLSHVSGRRGRFFTSFILLSARCPRFRGRKKPRGFHECHH